MRADVEENDLATGVAEGRYVREAIIGRGACGVVYRARDTVLGRTVALKVTRLDPSLDDDGRLELAARCEREARAAGVLSHPNIVTIHDAWPGPGRDQFQIVMEYVEGTTLGRRLAENLLDPAGAARIAKQVAAALAYAHRVGIVHRDVKPGNILIRVDGLAKLTDFGIARVEASDLTQAGGWIGSPAYMAPEQARGGAIDARTDIFALGLVMYEMIAGQRAFKGETLAVLASRIINETPPPPSRVAPGVSVWWDAVIMKALAKDPAERYASAGDLEAEVERLERGEAPLAMGLYEPPRDPGRPGEAEGGYGGAGNGDPAAGASETTLLPVAESVGADPRAGVTSPSRRAVAAASRRVFLSGAAALLALLAGILLLAMLAGGAPEATIVLDIVHGLGSGEISVEVDGETVWRGLLQEAGAEGGFRPFVREAGRFPPGRTSAEIRVAPGERTFSVRVDSEEGSWSGSARHRFEPGEIETLSIEIRNGRTAGLALAWEEHAHGSPAAASAPLHGSRDQRNP